MTLVHSGSWPLLALAVALSWTAIFVVLRRSGAAPHTAAPHTATPRAAPPAPRRNARRRLTAVGSVVGFVVVAVVQPGLPAWATPWTNVKSNGASSFDAYAWKSYQTTVTSDPQATHWWRLSEPGATTYAGAMPGTVKQVNGDYRGGHTSTLASPITGAGLNAASFDGSSQCVNLTDILDSQDRTPFSAEFWFYRTAAYNGRTMRLLSNYNGSTSVGWEVAINAPDHPDPQDRNSIYFQRTTASGGADYAGSGAPTASNTWYHVVATYDGAGMAFFLNGVQMGSASPSTRLLINDNQPLLLGCRLLNASDYNTYTEYFQGAIAEVSLYTVALTPRQVRSHYYASKANGTP